MENPDNVTTFNIDEIPGIPWTELHVACLYTQFHFSGHINRGPNFVPVTGENRNKEFNVRFTVETKPYIEKDGPIPSVLYRIVRIDRIKGFALLQSTFLDCLALQDRQDLEFILLDSRCKIFCGDRTSATTNFDDIERNDLMWIYQCELIGNADDEASFDVVESGETLEVVTSVKWAAIHACFASREYRWHSTDKKSEESQCEQTAELSEELEWETYQYEAIQMSEKDELLDQSDDPNAARIDEKPTKKEVSDQVEKVSDSPIIEAIEEPAPGQILVANEIEEPANVVVDDDPPPILDSPEDVKPFKRFTIAATLEMRKIYEASQKNHEPPPFVTRHNTMKQRAKVRVATKLQEVLTELQQKTDVDNEAFLNRDIFHSDEDEFGVGEKVTPTARQQLITELKNIPIDEFTARCALITFRQWTAPPDKFLQRGQYDATNSIRRVDQVRVNENFQNPVTYRVIAVLEESNQLIMESLFFETYWVDDESPGKIVVHGDYYQQQFLLLDMDSREGPSFDKCGFNIYNSGVNDIVCVYEVQPYKGTQPSPDFYARRMYIRDANNRCKIAYKAYAHQFAKLSLFKTLYGVVDDGRTIITGIDETIDNESLKQSIGTDLRIGDVFRIDVVQWETFQSISNFENLLAGKILPYATHSGTQKLVVVNRKILNDTLGTYNTPSDETFKLSAIEAADRQAAGVTLSKYVEAMTDRIECFEAGNFVQLEFDSNNQFKGQITLIEYDLLPESDDPDAPMKFDILLKVCVPDVGSFAVVVWKNGTFTVVESSKQFVTNNWAKIAEQEGKFVVSTIDTSPNADPAVRFLCNGGFARLLRKQAGDKKSVAPYQLVCSLLLNKKYPKDETTLPSLDELYIDPVLKLAHKTVTLDLQQQQHVKFTTARSPVDWPKIVVVDSTLGTGKTLCAVAVLKHTAREHGDFNQLVCTTSDLAVDNLAEVLEGLQGSEIRAIRIFSETQTVKMKFSEPRYGFTAVIERMSNNAERYNIEDCEVEFLKKYMKAYKKLSRRMLNDQRAVELDDINQQKKKLKTLLPIVCDIVKRRYQPQIILTTIDFFISNSITDSGNTLCRQTFQRVLIDEASQLLTHRLVLLANRNFHALQFVIYGDTSQVWEQRPPFYPEVMRPFFVTDPLKVMTKNMADLPVLQLSNNYRMHPDLHRMTLAVHYSSGTKPNSKKGPWKNKVVNWGLLKGSMSVGFLKAENTRICCHEFYKKEATAATHLVLSARRAGVKSADIAVVCLHEHYIPLVADLFRTYGCTKVEVGMAETFQGREKDYVVVLTTPDEDNCHSDFDFCFNPTIATTRAVLGMVILCHESIADISPHLKKLINYCNDEQPPSVLGLE